MEVHFTPEQEAQLSQIATQAGKDAENERSGKVAQDTTIALRSLEQNPNTDSRWAQLARKGHKVMQFLDAGRYVGVVVDGKVTVYGRGRN